MPWMISETKRARFSKDCGPYSSSLAFLMREKKAWPMLLPAALISTASKPTDFMYLAPLIKSSWSMWISSRVRFSAWAESYRAAVAGSKPLNFWPMQDS